MNRRVVLKRKSSLSRSDLLGCFLGVLTSVWVSGCSKSPQSANVVAGAGSPPPNLDSVVTQAQPANLTTRPVAGFAITSGGGISKGTGVTAVATVGEPLVTPSKYANQISSGVTLVPNLKGPLLRQ